MAERPLADRLVPSLLDRLTDDNPFQQVEPREARVTSSVNLRYSIQRDLEWLFNTTRLGSDIDLTPYPEVQSSVLNFGIPDLGAMTTKSAEEIEDILHEAIVNFEPRVIEESLLVSIVEPNKPRRSNRLDFQIEGQLWSQPLPQALYLRTEFDLDVHAVQIAKPRQRGS
ncbi:type VI secretion system protein ImpF [Pseudovibrio denitrificans]|uniref:Type VI secretion system protein ImpF n=2 Tax=Pseudovibrio TaxID=258255 RepID=A0A1I6XRC5_9HYPH|nr:MULTISPECIES: type VI secretion system baseplate subunit TssE [Pseudovibrio]EEA96935.1 type VI secretion system lysozyme-related protein [Pseudovibrio sp. JE062]QUS57646.1 type VI secretion system baseplate subunit TssE [Pseudovibrio brasiliensis]SFT40663.1 type VI secretion system protein ImpF [Pseudovibrio denitrificans]